MTFTVNEFKLEDSIATLVYFSAFKNGTTFFFLHKNNDWAPKIV